MKGATMKTDLMLSYIAEIEADVRHIPGELGTKLGGKRKEAALSRLATLKNLVRDAAYREEDYSWEDDGSGEKWRTTAAI